MYQPIPEIDELITRFIHSPHDPLLQERIAMLREKGSDQSRYVEQRLEAWLRNGADSRVAPVVRRMGGVRHTGLHGLLKRWWWVVAAVPVFMVILFFLCYTPRHMVTHTNRSGHLDSLLLANGSSIIVNNNAAISYDSSGNNSGLVEVLSGKVFISLSSDASCKVRLPSLACLQAGEGAVFSICSAGATTHVFVVQGKVKVIHPQEGDAALTPAMLATIKADKPLKTTTLKSDGPLAWKTGRLCFDNVPAEEVLDIVCSHYNIIIHVPPSARILYNVPISVDFTNKSDEEMINLLQAALDTHIVKDSNDEYYISLK
ncbi:FecR family protein [Chitinophaga solisilvae]|uniref:FecR family protein n=1 Tax=Chitinophaga solisilvae TaxID=1233460 RepID=UPI001370CC4E|nr:FecR family protein [Chitinophaga solisilvae]